MAGARDPVALVRARDGHARTADLLPEVSRASLNRAVREGRLLRPGRGVYVLPRLPEALVLAARLGGVVSHGTAAALLGIQQIAVPAEIHVTVRHGSGRRPPEGVRVHQTRHLPDDDVDQGVTTPVRTVLDCASTMPFRDALAIADSALSRSFIREQATLIGAAECTRGPGRTRRIRVGRLADWRADNPFESTLRAILLEAGITGFEPQLRIRLRHRTIYVDLGNEHLKIVIEADSFEFHGTRDALKRDTERYGELAAEGWIVLRFTYEHVMWRQDYVLEQIGVALRSRRSPFKTSARSSPPERTVRA